MVVDTTFFTQLSSTFWGVECTRWSKFVASVPPLTLLLTLHTDTNEVQAIVQLQRKVTASFIRDFP